MSEPLPTTPGDVPVPGRGARSVDDEEIPPELDADSRSRADWSFFETLLEPLHVERSDAWSRDRQRKIARVLSAITAMEETTNNAKPSPNLPPAPIAAIPSMATPVVAAPSRAHQSLAMSEARASRQGGRRRALIAGLTLALGIAGLALFWTAPFSSQAMAAIQHATEAARLPIDRQYALTLQLGSKGEIRTVLANLYVRGGDHFVLKHSGKAGTLWIGGNDRTVWLIPPIGPAFIARDPRRLNEWMSERDLPLSFLRITSLLAQLSTDCRLDLLEDERLPAPLPGDYRHIRATRRNPLGVLPATIDLWVDHETGLVRRVVCDWNRRGLITGPLTLTLDLVDDKALPDDFFDGRSHLDPTFSSDPRQPTRSVIELGTTSQEGDAP